MLMIRFARDEMLLVLPNELLHRTPLRYQVTRTDIKMDGGLCISTIGFAVMMAFTVVSFLSAVGLVAYSMKQRK
jgi:hypothetical protein